MNQKGITDVLNYGHLMYAKGTVHGMVCTLILLGIARTIQHYTYEYVKEEARSNRRKNYV